jgi:hypothetical protein
MRVFLFGLTTQRVRMHDADGLIEIASGKISIGTSIAGVAAAGVATVLVASTETS